MSKKREDDEFNFQPKSSDPNQDLARKEILGKIIIAIIGMAGLIGAALVGGLLNCAPCELRGERQAEEKLLPTIGYLETQISGMPGVELQMPVQTQQADPDTSPISYTGQVVGILTDRSSNGLTNMTISIENGPETTTDSLGSFVLENVPTGPQRIIVRAPTTSGQFNQNIFVNDNIVTTVSLVFDIETMQLGLLSITSPVSNSLLDAEPGVPHRQIITGRCDGLAQIYGSYQEFNIWVLVRAIQDDSHLWVQHPAALVDRNNNTWQTSIYMGDTKSPPYEGQRWVIIAVAAASDSGMDEILNISGLEDLLFPIITSNVVSVDMNIDPETIPSTTP